MCLAVPMKIQSIDGDIAKVEMSGVSRTASIVFLESANVGDYVLIHAGFAIEKLDEKAAMETLELLAKIGEMSENGENG